MKKTRSRSTARRKTLAVLAAATVLASLAAAGSAGAGGRSLADRMAAEVTGAKAWTHLAALADLTAANGGHRVSGSPGYEAAANYLTKKLQQAGYVVKRQPFTFPDYRIDAETVAETAPQALTLHPQIARFSVSTPDTGLTAPLAVPSGKDTGCTADDYAGTEVKGKVVLVNVGDCFITQKQLVLAEVGASAMLMNAGSPNPDLNLRYRMVPPEDARIPTATLPRGEAEQLQADLATGAVTLNLDLRGGAITTTTYNLIADTPTGRADNTIVMGAHLDSVDTAPGINDNGAAAAMLLETALRLAPHAGEVRNRVRFAWWAAEEKGLAGSQFYVDQLTAEQREQTALYLNLEMIGSPNYLRQVYNGQTETGPAPAGSAQISQLVNGFFADRKLPTTDLVLDGRSDHSAFVNAGIAAGGVNAGSDAIKTAEQVKLFGGTEGQMLDPCYHQECDTLANVNKTIFDQNGRAMAWAIGRFAVSTADVNGR
ncbi:M28 family peptidase [Amycolatopsis sp. DSM 110486]|uniref:M28 family peptidase n=1 Tax=Amycolatopsis sp. DSM 110486 TaxID=2865832 RepID=UPI001C694983|nr:M28 family peptidase [Amycolatopsis sp. DSM 110486]QYN21271.1 M28 family peptidase [Amycolatopsis sp. DSM 110486]